MSKYAWIITHVNTKELGEDMADEVGVRGPSAATPELLARLSRADGGRQTFRMLDDDGIWYYRGYLVFDGITAPELSKHSEPGRPICAGMGGDEQQEFGPLNDFGMPNAGCTEIYYRCDDPTTIDGGQPAKVWAIL